MSLPTPHADDLLARLPASPDPYPQKLDFVRGAVLVLEMDRRAYREASFLDDRILGPQSRGGWLHVAHVCTAAERVAAPRPVHFVFHSGHVGSTLVSRLLDESGSVLGLREPLPLRTLAEAWDVRGRPESLLSPAELDGAVATFLRLWSRGYDDTSAVVVKATSTVGRLAPQLLRFAPDARAVWMNLRAEPYIATLLAGANSLIDLRGHAAERMRRLAALTRAPLGAVHSMSAGELAAQAWLAEASAERAARRECGDRVLGVDFDAFLADVPGAVRAIVAHLGIPADGRWLESIDRSPALTRYSKAPDMAYGPGMRAELLRATRATRADEIRRGLAWLERVGRSDPAMMPTIGSGLAGG